MSPKKKSTAEKQPQSDQLLDKGIQAVVLADSLEETFRPLSCDLPKCLFPFCGVPLLIHSLEFLKRNNVTDILLLTTTRDGSIEAFVQSSLYAESMKIEVVCLSTTKCLTFGDVAREVEDRNCDIKEDFLLMFADTICTADIGPILNAHHQRRMKDPTVVMTKLFSPSSPTSRHRMFRDDAVVVYDATTLEMVAWDSVHSDRRYHIDSKLLQRNSCGGPVKIRYDLLDFGMAICTPRLLQLFSESFDHMSLRDDFCKDILTTPIKTDTVYVKVLDIEPGKPRPFAVRISDPRTYYAAACAIMERATYPMVLDPAMFPEQPVLINIGAGVYKAKETTLGKDCSFGPLSAVFPKSSIGDKAIVKRSIVGSQCEIQNGAAVEQSVLLGNVVIEEGARCYDSILSFGVRICRNAEIGSGCLIGRDVVVGPDTKVPPLTRLTVYEEDTEDKTTEDQTFEGDFVACQRPQTGSHVKLILYRPRRFRRISEERLKTLSDPQIVGADGKGVVYGEPAYCGTFEATNFIGGKLEQQIPLFVPKLALDDDETDEESIDGEGPGSVDGNNLSAARNKQKRKDDEFESEIREFLISGFNEPSVMHHKLLELKSFRLASEKTDGDVIAAAVPPLLNFMKSTPLDFALWMEKFESIHADKLFESFFDDSSPTHHFTLYDSFLEYCRGELSASLGQSHHADESKEMRDDDSDGVRDLGEFGYVGMLSFLLQVVGRLNIVDDEFTAKWYRSTVKQETNVSDKDETVMSLLSFQNLLEYVEWLEQP